MNSSEVTVLRTHQYPHHHAVARALPRLVVDRSMAQIYGVEYVAMAAVYLVLVWGLQP